MKKDLLKRLIEHNSKIIKEGKLDSLDPKRKLTILYEILMTFADKSNLPKIFVLSLDKFESHAMYYPKDVDNDLIAGNILVDEDEFNSNFAEVLEHFVHEIKHYLQDKKWNTSLKDRQEMIKGYKLPPDVDLENLSFSELGQAWDKIYQYKNNPLEKEAFAFGRKHFARFFDQYTESL